MNFAKKIVLIGGTNYAGEIKKSVFTYLNYILPPAGRRCRCTARPMSATDGDSAVFFGLSGTGKTTLSADAARTLIGDDEHGWAKDGVFNFEGGCYAKAIKLSREAEPEIFATTDRFGTVMENVVLDPADPRSRFRRRLQDREHPRRLSARLHPQRFGDGPRAAIRKNIVHADLRRLRRAAADRQARRRPGDVPLPVRLYRQGRGHREGRAPSRPPPSRPASARPSCRAIPRNTAICCAT